jgi:rubrerythrin
MKIKRTIIIVFALITGLTSDCSYTPSSDTAGYEQTVKNAIVEKVQRIGYYTLASKQAENEGYGEIAVYFSEIAKEEIEHIEMLSVLNIKPEKKTKKNVKKAMKMEKNAFQNDCQLIIGNAKQRNEEEVVKVLEQIARDEKRHYLGLRGLIKKKKVK